jgi:DNA-binding NarL/FixJ family response regulator
MNNQMNKKILIVEDDILVASDIKQIVQSNGYEVTGIANNANKAYELFINNVPDLVLCDVNLRTKRTGIDFVAKARKIIFVPVVYITAYSDEKTLSKAVSTSPESYLIKPFTKIQLLTSIKFALQKSEGHKKEKVSFEKKFLPPSEREMEIMQLLCEGMNSREISEKLNISIQTVQTHRKNLMAKYKVNKVVELVAFAQKHKLV